MKRIALLVCSVLLLAAGLPTVKSRAAGASPVIALTQTPAYGESKPFEGIVFCEDGGRPD